MRYVVTNLLKYYFYICIIINRTLINNSIPILLPVGIH